MKSKVDNYIISSYLALFVGIDRNRLKIALISVFDGASAILMT